jgi:hypothetical protein
VDAVFFRLKRFRGFLGVGGGLGGADTTIGADSWYSLFPVDGVGGVEPPATVGDLVTSSTVSSFALV